MRNGRKRDDPMNDIDFNFLNQLVVSLEQAEIKLEQAFKRKRPEQFNATKKFILNLNKKILEEIE